MTEKTKDEKFSDKEAKRRFEAALRGARLATKPPKKKEASARKPKGRSK